MSKYPTARLGDLCTVTAGGTPARSNPAHFGGTIPWVKIGDMLQGCITATEESITDLAVRNSAAKILPAGTVLISIFATIGRTAVLGVDATTNQAIAGIAPRDPNLLSPTYLRRYLDSVVTVLERRARGVAQVNINAGILKSLEVPLPSLDEQRRIAEVLDRADELRAKRRRALAHLDELTRSIFLGMFPPEMSTTSLGDHLSFVTSGGRGWAQFYAESGKRFIRSLDVRMNEIGSKDAVYVKAPDNTEARRTAVRTGDVLLTITGSRIGRVAVVPSELKGAYISQHVAILRLLPGNIRPDFLSFYLSLKSGGQRQIAKAQYGQTKPGLNFDQIREFLIPLPPLSMQDEFRHRRNEVEKLKAAHTAALAELDALFASLQDRAFKGSL